MTPKLLTKRYFIEGFKTFSIMAKDRAYDALSRLTIDKFEGIRDKDVFVGYLTDEYNKLLKKEASNESPDDSTEQISEEPSEITEEYSDKGLQDSPSEYASPTVPEENQPAKSA